MHSSHLRSGELGPLTCLLIIYLQHVHSQIIISLQVIIQQYLILLLNLFSFGHCEYFQLSSMSLFDIPNHCGCFGFFKPFLKTFWQNKKQKTKSFLALQDASGYFLYQFQKQPFLQETLVLLLEKGIRNQNLGTGCAYGY